MEEVNQASQVITYGLYALPVILAGGCGVAIWRAYKYEQKLAQEMGNLEKSLEDRFTENEVILGRHFLEQRRTPLCPRHKSYPEIVEIGREMGIPPERVSEIRDYIFTYSSE